MSGAAVFPAPLGKIAGLAALWSAGLLVATPLLAQDRFTGTWSGELDVGAAQLRLVLHVEPGEEGHTAALDSPDQGAFGIPASGVTTMGDSIIVEFAQIAGRYAGAIDAEGTRLSGTWSQGGQTFPLALERGELEEASRPQHPEPPFPYREEEVRFAGGSDGIELAGTMTLPEAGGPHPAAILVSGSGPQDRNEAAGMPPAQRAASNSLQRRLMDVVTSDRDRAAAQEEIAGLLRAEVPGLAAEQALAQAEALTSPWMQEFLCHDPRPVLRELTVPVLAVNGENDLQVLAGPNLAAIEAALSAAGNEDFETVEFEGLNHLLQTSETGLVTEYGRIEETIAPIALRTIGDWIVERVRT